MTRALLVHLNLRAWKGTVSDREIAEEAEFNRNAQSGTMMVIKRLTPPGYIKPIESCMRLARAEHHAMTTPGLMEGQRLMAVHLYERYLLVMGEIKRSWEQRCNHYFEIYPDIVASAPERQGRAYKASDFPTPAQIRSYFTFDYGFHPVPNYVDWRLDGMDEDKEEELRNKMQDEVRSMYNNATQTLFNRAHDMLARIAAQAKNFDKGVNGFHEATITNLKEIAHLIVQMNVTGDKELDRLGYQMIEQFADMQVETLRNNEEVRNRVKDAVAKMMARIPK